MSSARFTVNAQLDCAGGKKKGTVVIDRETNIVSVRPHKSPTTYQMKLDDIADLIVKKGFQAELERFTPKKARRAS